MLFRKICAGHRALFSSVYLNEDKVCIAHDILRHRVCGLHTAGAGNRLGWQPNLATDNMAQPKDEAFVLNKKLNNFINRVSISRSYYKGAVTPIDKIKSSFLKFEGGSVDLTKVGFLFWRRQS